MGAFPFLIDYGNWVWPLLGALFLVPWWLSWRAVVKLWASRRRRAHLRRLGAPSGELEGAVGAVVAVDGVLELEGEPVDALEGGFRVAASSVECKPDDKPAVRVSRAGRLWLVTATERVHLSAPLGIGAGSREFSPVDRLWELHCCDEVRAALGDRLSKKDARRSLVRFRSLSSGDRVRVVGRLACLPSEGKDYRSAAVEWVLRAAQPGAVALEAGLLAGRVRCPGSYRQRLRMICVGLLAAAGLSSLAGHALLVRGQRQEDPTLLQMAAVMPFQRAEARSSYTNWREQFCVAEPELMVEGGRLWTAKSRLRSCPGGNDERIVAGFADAALANYARASDELAGRRLDGRRGWHYWTAAVIATHVAAHQYDRALQVARAWEKDEPKPERQCLRLMLAHRVGDPSVAGELRGRAHSKIPLDVACWVLGYEIDPDIVGGRGRAEQRAALELATLIDAERAPSTLDRLPRFERPVCDQSALVELGWMETPLGLYRSAYLSLEQRGDQLGPGARKVRSQLADGLGRAAQITTDDSSAKQRDCALIIWLGMGPAAWAHALREQRDLPRACGQADMAARYTPAIQAHYRALLNRDDSLLYWALARAY